MESNIKSCMGYWLPYSHLTLAIFKFDLDPLSRSNSSYRWELALKCLRTTFIDIDFPNRMQPLRMFSISIHGHLFEYCANRQTWNVIISKTVTDRTNKSIAIKYKVIYGLSIVIFTFDLEPLGGQSQIIWKFELRTSRKRWLLAQKCTRMRGFIEMIFVVECTQCWCSIPWHWPRFNHNWSNVVHIG